ncbi:MAG: zinc ribbon domain-containing protein [Lachnospiraceae bacterium]|nr:zinc ribbon domain-containing protein [Lachnospiraceae bacterium]
MILYGTKTFRKILGYTTTRQCGHCGNETRQAIVRNFTWFTLFFIPLIPLWMSYTVVCPSCQKESKIKKKDIEGLMASQV